MAVEETSSSVAASLRAFGASLEELNGELVELACDPEMPSERSAALLEALASIRFVFRDVCFQVAAVMRRSGLASNQTEQDRCLEVNRGMRVLVVDDDELFLRALRRSYEAIGLEVRTALSPPEIHELIIDWEPNAAIVDLHLDNYDEGLTVVAELRLRCPDAHIALVSGMISPTMQAVARERGADIVVEKPGSTLAYLGVKPDEPHDYAQNPDHISRFPTLEEAKRAHFHLALMVTGGNHTRAADLLGIDRRTLLRTLHRWNVR